MKLDADGTIIDWCSTRADFYREQYLALAPTTGSANSENWNKWSRLGAGTWLGPDTVARTNTYGDLCSSSYSWCLEPTLSGVEIVVLPDVTGQCELQLAGASCNADNWMLTIQVGLDRLAACGF